MGLRSAKTTGVGGEARRYDCGSKVRGRKRHLLVNTEGSVLEKVLSADVPDQDGIGLVLERARDRLPRLSHPWVDTGYRGRGKEWAERALGLDVVTHPSPKPTPEKVLFAWAREWHKEGRRSVDLDQLLLRREFEVLPRRWVVERTFASTAATGE